jgi:hypothetical protein
LDTPRRARSASRVIGCPCRPWCSAAARRAAASSASSPPSCARPRHRSPGTAVPARTAHPQRRPRPRSGGGGGRRGARSSRPRPGTRRAARRPRSGPRPSAGPGPDWPPGSAAPRPRAPPWATTAASPYAELLVALPLAGGHHAGQVDADRHGPGHRPALAVLGGGVADVSERARPGDHREHGDRQRVGDREQPAARAHQPSRRPARPGRPGGPSPPRPGLASLPLCRSGAASVNAESFTPGCLQNARPALTPPAATVPPATRGSAPGGPGRNPLHLQKSGF